MSDVPLRLTRMTILQLANHDFVFFFFFFDETGDCQQLLTAWPIAACEKLLLIG